jgi:hypothetical protein
LVNIFLAALGTFWINCRRWVIYWLVFIYSDGRIAIRISRLQEQKYTNARFLRDIHARRTLVCCSVPLYF